MEARGGYPGKLRGNQEVSFLRKPARRGVKDPLTGQESVANPKKNGLQVMFAGPFACRFLFPHCFRIPVQCDGTNAIGP